MLAEMVDHVIGVDPDRDRLTAVLVDAKARGELAEAVPTTPAGYAARVDWADEESVADARVWWIEGAGSMAPGCAPRCRTSGSG